MPGLLNMYLVGYLFLLLVENCVFIYIIIPFSSARPGWKQPICFLFLTTNKQMQQKFRPCSKSSKLFPCFLDSTYKVNPKVWGYSRNHIKFYWNAFPNHAAAKLKKDCVWMDSISDCENTRGDETEMDLGRRGETRRRVKKGTSLGFATRICE